MKISINTAYSRPVRTNQSLTKKNQSFGDFKHCEVNYKTEKMTPETKTLLEKAKKVYEQSQQKLQAVVKDFYRNLEHDTNVGISYEKLIPKEHTLKTVPEPLSGYSFSPTYEALMENGKTARGYSIDAGRDTKTFPIIAAGDEIGMWPREYKYMYENVPGYDINKDVQNRLKEIIEVHEEK